MIANDGPTATSAAAARRVRSLAPRWPSMACTTQASAASAAIGATCTKPSNRSPVRSLAHPDTSSQPKNPDGYGQWGASGSFTAAYRPNGSSASASRTSSYESMSKSTPRLVNAMTRRMAVPTATSSQNARRYAARQRGRLDDAADHAACSVRLRASARAASSPSRTL